MDPIVIVIIVLVVLNGFWYLLTYNRLVRMRNETERAWSNIDVLLQQRYDMLPNLVSTVKGYAEHEAKIFEEFAKARQMASGARAEGNVSGVAKAEGLLSSIMPQIYAVAEQYPELKADNNFMHLQKEIVSIENQVADRREFYNSAVSNWNTSIEVIPAKIVAGTIGAQRKDTFEVKSVEIRQGPKIEF